jgi:hypothetical protein
MACRRRSGKRCPQDVCGLGRGWPESARTGLGGLRFGDGASPARVIPRCSRPVWPTNARPLRRNHRPTLAPTPTVGPTSQWAHGGGSTRPITSGTPRRLCAAKEQNFPNADLSWPTEPQGFPLRAGASGVLRGKPGQLKSALETFAVAHDAPESQEWLSRKRTSLYEIHNSRRSAGIGAVTHDRAVITFLQEAAPTTFYATASLAAPCAATHEA